MNKHHAAHFLILFIAILFWGLSFVFTKTLLSELTPIAIIFFRMVISATLLLAVCALFFRQSLRSVRKIDWLFILALSFFEPFLYFIFETYSLQITDASIVSVIIATIPIFSVFLSVFYFKENLSKMNISGVFVSVVGIVVMLSLNFRVPHLINGGFCWHSVPYFLPWVIASFCANYQTVTTLYLSSHVRIPLAFFSFFRFLYACMNLPKLALNFPPLPTQPF